MIDALLSGDRRALARLITQIENDRPEAHAAMAALYPRGGRAHVVGITGAPGTGKSTLVNEIARLYRRANRTVAIIAVDPTSPFTGGAILGDRIRMRDLAGDEGVFIRSMATRGSLGGIARATGEVASVLDAVGFNVVIIETLGAGQSEVEVAQLAHTTVVVEAPGLGDDVQAIKAGILEIADVLVVNKADQPNAEAAVRVLRGMLALGRSVSRSPTSHHPVAPLGRSGPDVGRGRELNPPDPLTRAGEGRRGAARTSDSDWEARICETVAIEGKGVPELAAAIDAHRSYLEQSGELVKRQRERIRRQIESTLRDLLYENFMGNNRSHDKINAAVEAVVNRTIDPYSAVVEMLK